MHFHMVLFYSIKPAIFVKITSKRAFLILFQEGFVQSSFQRIPKRIGSLSSIFIRFCYMEDIKFKKYKIFSTTADDYRQFLIMIFILFYMQYYIDDEILWPTRYKLFNHFLFRITGFEEMEENLFLKMNKNKFGIPMNGWQQ